MIMQHTLLLRSTTAIVRYRPAHILPLRSTTAVVGYPPAIHSSKVYSRNFSQPNSDVAKSNGGGLIPSGFSKSSNGESRGKTHGWRSWLSLVGGGVGAFLVGILGIYVSWYTYSATDSLKTILNEVSTGMKKSHIPKRTVYPFVTRKVLQEVIKRRIMGMSDLTILVSGPRGAGKSTAIELALADRTCVMKGNFSSTVEDLCLKLCSSTDVHRKPDSVTWEQVFTASLKMLKKTSIKPVLFVEVNFSVSPHQLQELLLFTKEIGFEQNLAQVIVVLSSSRVTEGLTIGASQLRCRHLVVGDLMEAERNDYLRQIFSKFPDSKVEGLIKSAEAVGSRLINLHRLYEDLKDVDSEAGVELVVKEIVHNEISLCKEAIRTFVIKNQVSPHKIKCVFEKLIKGEFAGIVHDVSVQLDIPLQALTRDRDVAAHVFFVHPETREVLAGSKFMLQAMMQFNSSVE